MWCCVQGMCMCVVLVFVFVYTSRYVHLGVHWFCVYIHRQTPAESPVVLSLVTSLVLSAIAHQLCCTGSFRDIETT